MPYRSARSTTEAAPHRAIEAESIGSQCSTIDTMARAADVATSSSEGCHSAASVAPTAHPARTSSEVTVLSIKSFPETLCVKA